MDDAGRYINTCEKKYDVITLDLFLNETPPGHVLTLESFKRMKEMLNPGGMVMMNFYGYISGEKGRASRCILNTFCEAGFFTDVLATPGEESSRNLIFLAQPDLKDFSKAKYAEPGLPPIEKLTDHFLDLKSINFQSEPVLTDEVPMLEKIYLPAALDWRRGSINYNLVPLLNAGVEHIR